METLLFGPSDVRECISMPDAIDAVEDAFRAYHEGEAVMPAKSYVDLPQYNGDFRAMPAYVEGAAGVKWVNSHPENPDRHGLPTVMGVMIYSDPETALPLAIMDGTTLTRYRTGAVAGVATRHLAPSDASTLGLVGAGAQAKAQLDALRVVMDLKRVVVYDIDKETVEEFVAEEDGEVDVVAGDLDDVGACDVVSTTTPSREPVLLRRHIDGDVHVNAMGADAKGKQELDPEILLDALVVVDDWEQCRHSGEINVPLSDGNLNEDDIHGTLGAVVAGDLEARGEITVFDSTGLAIQDVATSRVIYERGEERGLGTAFKLVAE